MSISDTVQEDRARLNFDFEEEEEDTAQAKEQFAKKIEEISNKSGFTARSSSRNFVKEQDHEVADDPNLVKRPRRRRAKTGRTYPFNTKIKPETYDKICDLADTATVKEGRPVSLAEIIERAIEALETK